MKIISKFKDYYDFIAGHDSDSLLSYPRQFLGVVNEKNYKDIKEHNPIGIRNLVEYPQEVLDKIKFKSYDYLRSSYRYSSSTIPEEKGFWIFLAFCGTEYNIFRTSNGEYIYSIEEFIEKVDPKKELYFTKSYGNSSTYYESLGRENLTEYFKPKSTNINELLNCPVLVYYPTITCALSLYGYYINQRLLDLQFNKAIPPMECYQTVYNWISAHKPEAPIPNSPNDMNRLESKGFDVKKSFRHRK